jgi:hypothetical protein
MARDLFAHGDDAVGHFVAGHRGRAVRRVALDLSESVGVEPRPNWALAGVVVEARKELEVGETQLHRLDLGQNLMPPWAGHWLCVGELELIGAMSWIASWFSGSVDRVMAASLDPL